MFEIALSEQVDFQGRVHGDQSLLAGETRDGMCDFAALNVQRHEFGCPSVEVAAADQYAGGMRKVHIERAARRQIEKSVG
jgi:hypothetical protein